MKVIVTATFDALDAGDADRVEQAIRTLIAEFHLSDVRIERRDQVR